METGKPKNSRAASRLETPARVGIAVLVQRLETQAEFLCCHLNAEFLLLWGALVFVLKASSSMDEAHLRYGVPST